MRTCARQDAEAPDRPAGARRLVAFAVLMLMIGNAKSLWGTTSLAGDPIGVLIGLLVSGVCLLYARCVGLEPAELGLTGRRAAVLSVGVGLGLIVGLVLAAAILARAAAALDATFGPPPVPGDLADLSEAALLRRILLYLPFDTILPEELVFRAVLLAELRRRFRSWGAPVLLSTVGFVIWHAALGLREVPDRAPDHLAVKFGAYAAGSLIFTVPLLATGHLAGCLLVHWLADALLMIGAHPLGHGLRETILPS